MGNMGNMGNTVSHRQHWPHNGPPTWATWEINGLHDSVQYRKHGQQCFQHGNSVSTGNMDNCVSNMATVTAVFPMDLFLQAKMADSVSYGQCFLPANTGHSVSYGAT